jgi:hypothetical protein
LTPQKPLWRAYEQGPKAVEQWLAQTYLAIRRAGREGGEIHGGDEMGLRSDHQAGGSLGRRGHTPVIPVTGTRFGYHLSRLSSRKVYLIVDGHPVHRGPPGGGLAAQAPRAH